MFLMISGRTDIPAFYAEWLMKRFEEGYLQVRNPYYPEKISTYTLSPDIIDGILFCSKNYEPFLPYAEYFVTHYPCIFDYTITAYTHDIEPNVPSIKKSIDTFKALAEIVGKDRMEWRYDPILLNTNHYTPVFHKYAFELTAEALQDHTSTCLFSFVNMYQKVLRNAPDIYPPNAEQRHYILQSMLQSASAHQLKLQCCPKELLHVTDTNICNAIDTSGCMTFDKFELANPGVSYKRLKSANSKLKCSCLDARDIGIYNTCPHQCLYCYANEQPDIADKYRSKYDISSPMLLDRPNGDEIVSHSKQIVYRKS